MSLQVWLEHVGRIPAAEARALLGVVDVLANLPISLTGLCEGWLSWGQVRAIARAARRVPVARLSDLDGRVQEWMADRADVEPDAIIADVWEWVDAAQPTRLEREEAARDRDEFLTLMPRLFGGGSIYGEFGPVGFTTLAEALDAPLAPPPAAPDDLSDEDAVAEAYDTLDEQRRQPHPSAWRPARPPTAGTLRAVPGGRDGHCASTAAAGHHRPRQPPRPRRAHPAGCSTRSAADACACPGRRCSASSTNAGPTCAPSCSTMTARSSASGTEPTSPRPGCARRSGPATWRSVTRTAARRSVGPTSTTSTRGATTARLGHRRGQPAAARPPMAQPQDLPAVGGPPTDATGPPSGGIAVMAGRCAWRPPDAAAILPPPARADHPGTPPEPRQPQRSPRPPG